MSVLAAAIVSLAVAGTLAAVLVVMAVLLLALDEWRWRHRTGKGLW